MLIKLLYHFFNFNLVRVYLSLTHLVDILAVQLEFCILYYARAFFVSFLIEKHRREITI